MNRLTYVFLLFLLTIEIAVSQDTMEQTFPDGVYYTARDFINKMPDTLEGIRKLNYTLPTRNAFMDTLINHVWFLNKENDRIAKVFAVVYQGEIYMHDYGMKKNTMPNFKKPHSPDNYKLHRVAERGHFLYGIRRHPVSNSNYAGMLGAQYGFIGALLGSLADAGMSSGMNVEYPFVFDSRSGKFVMINSKRALQQFMDTFYPADQFDTAKGKLDMEAVRQLFVSLNNR